MYTAIIEHSIEVTLGALERKKDNLIYCWFLCGGLCGGLCSGLCATYGDHCGCSVFALVATNNTKKENFNIFFGCFVVVFVVVFVVDFAQLMVIIVVLLFLPLRLSLWSL